jgi:hypothetical protein
MDLAMFLGVCNVPQQHAWTIIKLAKEPDNGVWARSHGKHLPDKLLSLVMNETAASTLCSFEPMLIPGLLQTRNYASSVIQGNITAKPEDVEPWLNARMTRQDLLKNPNSPRMVFFINEPVLHYPVCSPAAMNEQLLHLIFFTPNPRVQVRVVPKATGAHAGMAGSFMFMGFHDRRPMVFLEGMSISTLVEDREVVETYRMIRSELHRIALTEEESRYLLTDLASRFDREAEERTRDEGPLA